MIHNIIQISDIHIRIGDQSKSRYDEYCSAFSRLRETLQLHPSIILHNAVIAITGDVFHHKNKLEPCGLELAVKLLQGLSELAPVIVIRGNHDYRQDLPSERDMITALMSYSIPNVSYLDTTGLHTFDNLTIGVVAIQDTLLYGATSGISRDLPPFPLPTQHREGYYNVAMFHGSITGSTLQNGISLSPTLHGYPIDWFKGYDAILLGDIHVQQIHRADAIECKEDSVGNSTLMGCYDYSSDTSPWGYPGSLVQQDFGESLTGHGYLVWDLQHKRIYAYQLHHTHGFVKVRLRKSRGAIDILHRHKDSTVSFVPIDDIIRAPWFPSQLRVIVSGNYTDDVDLQHVRESFTLHDKTIHLLKKQHEHNQTPLIQEQTDTHVSSDVVSQINSIDVLIDYVQDKLRQSSVSISEIWKSWLKHPETMLISTEHIPDPITAKVADKSDKITKPAQKYIEDFERVQTRATQSGSVQLHSIEWSWILNYAHANFFNFDNNLPQTYVLNAKNGFGKSNFLETICIALFGEGFPSRYNKNYSVGIICHKKPSGVTAQTHIIFTLNGTRYSLKRTLRSATSKRSIEFLEVVLTIIDKTSSTILHQGHVAVSQWIDRHIGSYSSYLMSAMLSQNADSDFFSLDKKEQRTLLDQILSLEHIQSLQALMKSAILYYKSISEIVESYYTGMKHSVPSIPDGTHARLSEAQSELVSLQHRREELHSKWRSCSEQQLRSIGDYSSALQRCQQLELQSVQCPTNVLSLLEEQLTLIRTYRMKMSDIQTHISAFRPFVELPNHDGDYVKRIMEDRNDISTEHAIRLMNQYKQALESHPFYRKNSLYEDIERICEHFHDPSADTFDDELSSRIVSQFQAWDSVQQQKFSTYTSSAHIIQQLEEECALHQGIVHEYPQRIQEANKAHDKAKKKYVAAAKRCDELAEKQPNKPSVSNEWLQDTERTLSDHDSIEEIKQHHSELENNIEILPNLCMEYTRIAHDIEVRNKYIEDCADVPFNSRCSACKKQSWRVKYDSYTKELPTLTEALSQIDAELDAHLSDQVDCELVIASPAEYIRHAKNVASQFAELITRHDTYQRESQLMRVYTEWTTQYHTAKQNRSHAEKVELQCASQVNDLQHTLHASTEALLRIQNTIHTLRTQQSEYNEYKKEHLVRIQEYEHHLKQLDESWYTKLYRYRESIQGVVSMLEFDLSDLHDTLQQSEKRVAELRNLHEIKEKVAIDKPILDAYPSWLHWKECMEQEKSLLLRIREYEILIQSGSSCGDNDAVEQRSSLSQTLQEHLLAAQHLSTLFDGYRKWVYTTHMTTLIHQHTNHILQMICEEPPLQLDSEWLDTIDTLSWFINDGTSRVVIEKASGFQRFIVGIAVRVAFHQIGFCRIRFHQLFIDEGFTACDADHLEKVPSFLHCVLPYYSSIYLVTHLEDLKLSTTHHIHITRLDSGLSRIIHGKEQDTTKDVPMHPAEAPRRRGRPPKNTGVVVVTKD
jgi:DNA repair exonuclease SbcCD ATPase subunit